MIEKFLEYLIIEKNYSEHTKNAYQRDIFAFQNFCADKKKHFDIKTATYSEVRNWIVFMMQKKLSNKTINRKIIALKHFYKFLQKIQMIKKNPLQAHKLLKEKENIQVPFSKEEIQKMFDLMPEDNFSQIRDKLILEIFYKTGIRRSELLKMDEHSIDFHLKQIKIIGKGNKERFLPIPDCLKANLKKYIKFKEERFSSSDFFWTTDKGKEIKEYYVYKLVRDSLQKISLKIKKSPHMLRHSFATHLLENEVSLNTIKEMLGHSSLAATQIYTHLNLKDLKQKCHKSHPRTSKMEK